MMWLVLFKYGSSGCSLDYSVLVSLLVCKDRKSPKLAQAKEGSYLY